jgi:Putative porin
MLIKKITLPAAGVSLAAIALLTAQPLRAQSASDSARIEKLEQAVELLEKQNAELKAEVNSLKKHEAPAPKVAAEGPTKTEIVYDGKTYVEKSVPLEKSSADKWKLSTSITEMELYGDIRLRYQYNGGETQSRGPVAAPGAGIAGTNDWQERERERYRLRLGLRGTFLDDWFFGLRLETSNNARSTNVTFGDDTASNTPGGGGPFEKNSDTVYVGQAYGGYKGFPGFIFTGGRMPNPLVTTRMVWDPDINPEGLAEQWKHTFVFGAEAPPPPSYSKDYSKDGKEVVAPKPPEPFLKLDLFANFGQFVYDDANPENPLGARATTTANGSKQLIPNTDAFLLAWQVGARFNFPQNLYFQFAPTLYNYAGNGDTFNIHYVGGDPRLTNANSLNTNQTGINSLLVFDVPMEFGWKAWGIPMRIFGDFATNFEGDDRANAAVQPGPPATPPGTPAAQPGPGHGSQRYAFQAGLGIGQLKKKGDWQIDLWYQQIQQFALDPNLIDDDIFNAQENMHGIAVQATYNFTAAVNLQLTYAHGWWYNHNLGTGGNVGSLAIATNPTAEYNFFTADLNFKF